MLYGIFLGISYFMRLVYYALLAYCLLSWMLPPQHNIMRVLTRFVDPVLMPVRRLMYRVFPRIPLDLSALAAFFLLRVAEGLLWRLYAFLRF